MLWDFVRSLWAEPREDDPPGITWRDWALVGTLGLLAVLEGVFRPDLVWRPFAAPLQLIPIAALLWRRTHPLLSVAVAWSVIAGLDVATIAAGRESAGLWTMVGLLFFPYALFRWGSGREAVIGLLIMTLPHVMNMVFYPTEVSGIAGGFAFLLFPSALGAAVRFRSRARARDITEAKLFEREQMARELHDTVAHHVSAIVIQAQAGRTLAASDGDVAVRALETIEAEASRTLAEMRKIVGVLRRGTADIRPQQGLTDLERLARDNGDPLRVVVELDGDLSDVGPGIEAAVFRIAQESITNVRRHARHATAVEVRVLGDDEGVSLTVTDNGDAARFDAGSAPGYGLVGMAERASLHGGTLEAGPRKGRGWEVRAMLPKSGRTR